MRSRDSNLRIRARGSKPERTEKIAAYIALIRKEAESDYGVDFPDFPGCVTAGRSIGEAQHMAQEALEGHVAVMLAHGEALPEPTASQTVLADPANRDSIAFPVALRQS